MKRNLKYFILAIMIITGWLISLKVVILNSQKEEPAGLFSNESSMDQDSIIKHWEFSHFQFYLKRNIPESAFSDEVFTSVHLNSLDTSFFLFNCHPAIVDAGAEPKWLYDDIHSFPYYTGGNYSRSSGLEIFRILDSTVVYIGKVCGYKDIDKDGKSEFYIYIVTEYGAGQATNVYETVPVDLIGDSLAYPFLDGGY